MITVCEKIVTLKTVQKFMVLLIAKKILLSVRDIYLFKLTTTNQYSSKIKDFSIFDRFFYLLLLFCTD